jgi:ABC-type Fe2+-enterobactin transport system substrate-binding protein
MDSLNNIFKDVNLPIPTIVYSYDDSKQKEIYDYLSDIMNNEQQQKAYVIAFEHLGSSFNIYKSNGFKEWKSSQLQSKNE